MEEEKKFGFVAGNDYARITVEVSDSIPEHSKNYIKANVYELLGDVHAIKCFPPLVECFAELGKRNTIIKIRMLSDLKNKS